MLKFKQFINEGVNDPSIFKAVFLAGGPGSGKSFIVGKTALTALGFKVINSDNAFEAALRKVGLKPTPEDIYSPLGQEVRGRAKALTKKKMQLAISGRLGLVIDGTGKDYEKIAKQAEMLRDLGYEVAMIFVNTDLDTALERNRMRERSLPDAEVEKMWKDVQKNLGKFQNFFRQRMFIVDNSDGSNYEGAVLATYRRISQWAKTKPETNAAREWIKSQQKLKENSIVSFNHNEVRVESKYTDEFEEDILTINESTSMEKLVSILKKNVSKGKDPMETAWDIVNMTGINISPHRIYNEYMKSVGSVPKEKKSSSTSLYKKYGFTK
jgi:predicted kinase